MRVWRDLLDERIIVLYFGERWSTLNAPSGIREHERFQASKTARFYLPFYRVYESLNASMMAVTLIGEDIKTKAGLMDQMQHPFGLPDYFGKNWDALWECLNEYYYTKNQHCKITILDSEALIGKHREQTISFFQDLTSHWEKRNESDRSGNRFEVEYL